MLKGYEEEIFSVLRKYYMAISKAEDIDKLNETYIYMGDLEFMVGNMVDKINEITDEELADDEDLAKEVENFMKKIIDPFDDLVKIYEDIKGESNEV